MKPCTLILLLLTSFLSSSEIIVHTESSTITLGGITIHFFNETLNRHFTEQYTLKKHLLYIDQETQYTQEDLVDKIVLSPMIYGIDDQARLFQSDGAVGIIMGSTFISPEGNANYQLSQPRKEIVFPSVQLNGGDFLYLKNLVKKERVVVELIWTEFEMNPYFDIMTVYGIMGYVIGAMFFGVMIICCVVLFICNYLLNENAKLTIKIVLLGAILLTNVIRLLACCIDPFGSQLLLPWQLLLFFFLVNIPASIMCEFILGMYWLLRSKRFFKGAVCPFSLEIPIAIMALLYFCLLVILLVMSIVDPLSVFYMIEILNIFFGLSWAGISILYISVAICIFRRLQKLRVQRRKKYNLTFLVKVLGISFLDFVMILVILIVPFFEISPFLSLTTAFALIMLTGIESMIMLSLFKWDFCTCKINCSK